LRWWLGYRHYDKLARVRIQTVFPRYLFHVLALSLAAKLAVFFLVASYYPMGIWSGADPHEYQRLAVNLLKGGGFSQSAAGMFVVGK